MKELHQQVSVQNSSIYISTSTAEAEYYNLSECSKHCKFIDILRELRFAISGIYIDNKVVIYNAKNQSINPKKKHTNIRLYYVWELVKDNKIILKYIKFQYNLAYGFAKYLNSTSMDKFRIY